jgi:hypothetical protein
MLLTVECCCVCFVACSLLCSCFVFSLHVLVLGRLYMWDGRFTNGGRFTDGGQSGRTANRRFTNEGRFWLPFGSPVLLRFLTYITRLCNYGPAAAVAADTLELFSRCNVITAPRSMHTWCIHHDDSEDALLTHACCNLQVVKCACLESRVERLNTNSRQTLLP